MAVLTLHYNSREQPPQKKPPRRFTDMPLEMVYWLMLFLSLLDLEALSMVSRRMRQVVQEYMDNRFRRLLRHFGFRVDFRDYMREQNVVLGGRAAIRLALNDQDLSEEAILYTRKRGYPGLDLVLLNAGYQIISRRRLPNDVLRHSPIMHRLVYIRANDVDFRRIEVDVLDDMSPAEYALISTTTLAQMTIISHDSVTVFFPSLFFVNQTTVRRIPSALGWHRMHDAGWPMETIDLPGPMQRDVDACIEEGFEVGMGFDAQQRDDICDWDCPADALTSQRLFTTLSFRSVGRPVTFWRLRKMLAHHTQLTQYGYCLVDGCLNNVESVDVD